MRILVTGASGLVGQGALRACLDADDVDHVGALGRRAVGFAHPKLEDIVASDFARLQGVESRLAPYDACLYCAGILPLGVSEADFRRVTLDLTLSVARTLVRLDPAITFVYVSGAASDPASHLMPLRIKGETERALAALPIRTVMMRPGGVRPVGDVRSPHAARDVFYRLTDPLLAVGVMLAPRMMTTSMCLGRAMLQVLRQPDPPAVVENAEINRLGTQTSE